MSHNLLVDAAPSSVPSPKTSGWMLSHPALVRYQCTPFMLDMLVERSRHLQRVTHPKSEGWISLSSAVSLPWLEESWSSSIHIIPGFWAAVLRDALVLHSPHLQGDIIPKSTSGELGSFKDLAYSMIIQMLGCCNQGDNLWQSRWMGCHSWGLGRTFLNWICHWRTHHTALYPSGRDRNTPNS